MKLFLVLGIFISLWLPSLQAQTHRVDKLEEKTIELNNNLQYEKSIVLITDFITNENSTPYEKYKVYIIKANTYKRLFNYEETLHNLDLALNEGLKSNKKREVENIIKAEKAFVYFDTHDYTKASQLMADIAKSGYNYLNASDKSFIIMQEGYLLLLDKKYLEAELKLDQAIAITKKYFPRNLPVIYGKKVELYNAMKLYDKRDKDFNEGLKIAKEYKIIKYEMYMYEIIVKQYQINYDYKNAFDAQKKYDSLANIYNASNNNGKIELLEKKNQESQTKLEEKYNRSRTYFLVGIITLLLILLIISLKLYSSNKQKRKLVEKENTRIHIEIERLTKAIDNQGKSKFDLTVFDLTERQIEIATLIQQGKSNKDIGNQLFISENTVKYHLKIIYEILDIEHRLELKL